MKAYSNMKALIIGKSGQLARELIEEKPKCFGVLAFGRNDIDITSYGNAAKVIKDFEPAVLINASAYTSVDKAETTDTEKALAYAVNEQGVSVLSKVARDLNVRLLHVSTDFVFDGKQNVAYEVSSKPKPMTVYGASKLAGELALQKIFPHNSTIIRTSWVYSSFGDNFVKTMLKLMGDREELSVVCDQISSPTYAKGLARFLWKLAIVDKLEQIYHWSDSGLASWYDFAVAIQEIAVANGILKKKIPIKPITSAEYPSPAKRPKFSLLNLDQSNSIEVPQYWREQLERCMAQIKWSWLNDGWFEGEAGN